MLRRGSERAIWQAIHELQEQQMSSQQDVDTLVAQVATIATDLGIVQTDATAAQAKLQAEIDALAGANPGLDLSALQAAVAPIDAVVNGLDLAVHTLGNLTPPPPTPPAPPAPPAA